MIWSFLKIVLFVALVAAATLGAGYLLEHGGGIRISVAGIEFTLGPLQAVVAALLLVVIVWVALKLVGLAIAILRFLSGDETAVSRYFDRNRERKGYQALAEGMLAVAAGEGKSAMALAARAEKYLARPELTNLLSAQAAETAGDTRASSEIYKRLLADERTRFVGVRGLMRQKIAEGDHATALKLAEKAFELRPRHQEVQDTLLRLQTEAKDWSGARRTLGAKMKQGYLPRDVHRRRDALLAVQEARGVTEGGIEAREAAIAAAKASPDLIPAVVMAARSYMAEGKAKYAERLLRKAWEAQPHPDLAACFADLAPDESPADRVKRFDALLRIRPDHEEARLLKAELLLAAEDFPAARRALGDLVESHPTARALTIMAAIERGEGSDDAVVRGWLAKAVTASRGPQWVCDKCQTVHSEWTPVCNSCSGFDTLSWREPKEASVVHPTGAEMMPLIVGTSAGKGAGNDATEPRPADA